MENLPTIVSISTATGSAGIGIVRLSGANCFEILNKIFVPKNKKDKIKGYTMKYGNIVFEDQVIDEVLVSYFVSPKSYTRENMCEINTHGGMVVEKKILEACLKSGAILAEPGEFTKRAFLNGRIDLSQAEAIMDLISSRSEKQARESINQLEGGLSRKINQIENKLLDTITAIEVDIDYPEYDIEEIENRNALNECKEILKDIEKLEESFKQGKIIKDGIKTVILGKPNAGKSSLLNTLLNEDRAIVSDIEGTTRDTIEEVCNINGIVLNLIDTAGIRKTNNEIEKIGVEKAKKLANESELIIALFDITKNLEKEDFEILNLIKDKNAIVVLNKIDLIEKNNQVENEVEKINKPIIKISAKNNEGVDKLYSAIEKMFNLDKIELNNDVLITNERHKEQIRLANEDLRCAIDSMEKLMPIDMSCIYIKKCLEDLGEITGKNVSEDVINQIFKNFCLGK